MLPDIDKAYSKRILAFIALNLFGIFLVFLLSEFITPFLGAVIFYVLFKKFMVRMEQRWKWNSSLAAVVIILISFIIILIPIMGMSLMLYSKLAEIMSDPHAAMKIASDLNARVRALTGSDVITPESINSLKLRVANLIPSFLGGILLTVGNIGIMYFMLFYMLTNRGSLTREVNNYLPFEPENIGILADELESQTLSNAIGVPLVAIIQGCIAALGYWIFGVPEPVFWGAITAFASLLPLIGTALVWVPLSIFLLASGGIWQGVGLLLYGAIAIISLDNVARFMIQKRFADIHPLITVFGVIIGLNLFGLPGFIFGPLMLSYFVILIRMYRKVYHIRLRG